MESAPAGDLAERLSRTSSRYPFRRYQRLALTAFEAARAEGRPRSYLVLPPGAGKTALGLEIGRQVGQRTLVLCPSTAVQAQWLKQWQDFLPHTVAADAEPTLAAPLTVLTYQAQCNLNDDDEALAERALALWQAELLAEGLPPDEAASRPAALREANPPYIRPSNCLDNGVHRKVLHR